MLLAERSLCGIFAFMSVIELPQVQLLSVREKLELVDDLWRAVSSDLDAMEVTQEEKETLDKRWSGFLENPTAALTVDQFKMALNALRA
jgi:putative addiction module component (TIGR02574 family)